MQDPQAIISQAKGGAVPSTWRVLRPTPGYPARTAFGGGCLTLFALFFLSVCGFIVGGATAGIGILSRVAQSDGSSGFPFDVPAGTFGSLPAIIVVGVGGALVLAVIVALLSGRYAATRVPYSYFIFTPEGAVQSTGPGKIMAIDYATLDLVNMRIDVHRSTSTNPNTHMTTTSTTVSKSIELHYRDGRTKRWKPASRFGSTDAITQRLINGLQAYQQQAGGQG